MATQPIYLDYAATTPVLPAVATRMAEILAMQLGNPASNHARGRAALEIIESARAQAAALVGADPADVIFTSGATESNNLAIAGTARAAQMQGRKPHLVTLATEHKSVLETVRRLGAEGATTTILRPDEQGVLHPSVLAAALKPDTALVTLLHVNNETGVVQDVPAFARTCAAAGIPLHIDAAQGAGKLPIDTQGLALLSFTAHKLGGPQGIGALYVAPAHRPRLRAQMSGGSHERGLRAGTLAAHQIAGFGLACELAARRREQETERLIALREQLWQGIADLPGVLRNGRPGAPHILNASFTGIEGESLFTGLPELCLSTGSACNSRSGEASFVLRALGRDSEQAQSSLRFSFGHGTTPQQIDAAIAALRRVHADLWQKSPARAPLLGEGEWWLGEAGAERLGAWVRFALRTEGGLIREARVQHYGCPHTAAACSLLCDRLPGRPVGQPDQGTPESWRQSVHAPIEKLGRMLIIEDALNALRPAR